MQEAGYDVLLVGRKKSNSKPIIKQAFRQRRLNLFFEKGKIFYLEYNLRLFFFLLFHRFNIVCGVDLDTIVPCLIISKLKSKPCIYDAHELFAETPEVERRKSIQKFWKKVEKYAVTRIKKGICVSDGLKKYFEVNYQKEFSVIRNFPVSEKEISVTAKNKNQIIYQGALNEGRGLEYLIEAMKNVQGKLILAGEGDLSEQLRKQVKDSLLENKIEFKGFIEPSELKALTNQSTIGINILEARSKNYYHSLANKFFDYTSAGIPNINMRFPEYEKMNHEFEVSVLIDDLKPETISTAINHLLNDSGFYQKLHQNCLRAREEWNWGEEKNKLIKIFESCA